MLILKPLSIDWSVAGAKIPAVTFIMPAGLTSRELAHMLDSLVRVSRRVEENHLVIVVVSERWPRLPKQRPTTEPRHSFVQFTNEFYHARSSALKRATMSVEFSPLAN